MCYPTQCSTHCASCQHGFKSSADSLEQDLYGDVQAGSLNYLGDIVELHQQVFNKEASVDLDHRGIPRMSHGGDVRGA